MLGLRLRLALICAVIILHSLATRAPALAQAEDSWSFVITPQVWASHIAKNGFTAPSGLGYSPITSGSNLLFNQFRAEDSGPVDSVNPQWGLQLAAQKGRWTLAGSFQYVTFETRSDVMYSGAVPVVCAPQFPSDCLSLGALAAQEFVDTTRVDMDFSVSYFFPDVIANWLDFSVGGGLKVIYATASREYGNLSPFAADVAAIPSHPGKGLYGVCTKDDCSDLGFRDRVKTKTWLYGLTIPTSASFHLTNDAKWLLPFSVMPFIGAETRDDRDVVYRAEQNAYPIATAARDFKVKRLDGTTAAYGVTVDATIRWLINETLSTYAGMRVQYIKGHETYLAYGHCSGCRFASG